MNPASLPKPAAETDCSSTEVQTQPLFNVGLQFQEISTPLTNEEATYDWAEELLWTLPGIQSIEVTYEGLPGEEAPQAFRLVIRDVSKEAIEARLQGLFSSSDLPLVEIIGIVVLEESDWAESWKQFWKPTPIGDTFVICPSWETYAPKPNEQIQTQAEKKIIQLDPGQAFGTGTHPTTRLVLTQLKKLHQRQPLTQCSVMDVGCGSGILSIGAALLGATTVMALDIEAEAVFATEKNAGLNGVGHCIHATATPLGELCQTRYDIILANIIAPVIVELLPEMVKRLNPGGEIWLSGLVAKNWPTIEAALTENNLSLIETHQDGDWFLYGVIPA